MFGLGSSKPKASADTTTKSSASASASSKPSSSPSPSISKSNPSSSSSFSEGDLTVVSTPEAHLVFTNYVYVSLDQYAAMGGGGKESDIYLLLKDTIIYIVKGHKLIETGTIALSALQRESLKISSGMPIKVIVYSLPTTPSFNLVSLKAEVSLISKRKITIKEAELTQFLRAAFKQHIITRGQIFCCDFEGTSLKIIPKVLESAIDEKESESKDGNITQFVKIGLLLPSTIIQIEAEETKLFKVEKDQSKAHSRLFSPNFQFADMGIGGLDKEFNSIFRRAFASRLFPTEIIEQMGIKHVRGMLLYGPPGTGKTLIARQIGKMLNCREPKVVNGPEILNKYVGASEENIRKLFADAEADYAANKEGSDLHLIIFDEIDAICKARGSDRGGTGVHDTVVNQLLSKLDGVNSLNNILVIGMTNRKDMIDPALLRPGRLEVHIEIALPDERGRVDIFKIHTRKMRENGKLGKDVDLEKLAQLTKNFSGAEIEGLVKSASSFALYGSIDVTKETVGIKDNMTGVVVTMDDFMAALEEVTPAFGVAEDELKGLIRRPLIDFGIEFKMVLNTVGTLIKQLQNGDRDLLSVLLEGPPSCGKTSVAAQLALDSGFPFVKLISPDNYVGMSESSKCYEINKVFEDAYRSHQSLIIVDGIERLLEYVPIGPRFSNQVLQTLSVLINRVPPKEKHKLFIIATTNNSAVLEEMQMLSVFNVIQAVPQITQPSQITRVMIEALKLEIDSKEAREIADKCIMPISMGNLLLVIDMARQDPRGLNAETFQECILNAGLAGTKKY